MRLEEIKAILAAAERTLSFEPGDGAEFVESLQDYMSLLENWRNATEKKMQEGAVNFTPELRQAVERLQDVHALLTERALTAKEGVAEELRELRIKGQAMRAYGDVLPGRVTITGKREG